MKIIFYIIPIILIFRTYVFSQLQPFGLDSIRVTDLRFYGNILYASTDSHGVFKRYMSDTEWISLGLEGKRIQTVYPHQVGPVGFAVTVGMKPDRAAGDSTLIYCWFNQTWNITDSGMSHEDTWEIRSIDGIPTPQICGETFAGGSGKVFRKKTNFWETVFELAVINIIRVSPKYEIWIGGETNIFWPFLAKSTDIGDTWTSMYPNLAGDNACNSIAFDPSDSNIVYAGMEGVVIKTIDGGLTWKRTGLTDTPFYLRGLTINPSNPSCLYAGGIASPDSFGLFQSTDAGETWQSIIPPTNLKGISSIEINPMNNNEIFIATLGNGVLRYTNPVINVQEHSPYPSKFLLWQNYPNPFNPSTMIRFEVPKELHVTLKVYNLLGQEVAILVNEKLETGKYEVEFDGSKLPSGVYFYRLISDEYVSTNKLLLIR